MGFLTVLEIFLALAQVATGLVQLVANFLEVSSLFFELEVMLGSGSIQFVLLGAEFALDLADGLVELVDPVVVGLAVPL